MISRAERIAELRRELALLESEIKTEKEVEKQLWHDNLIKLTEITDRLSTEKERKQRRCFSHIIARRLCCYYMRNQTGFILQEMADIVGLKNHATVIDHIKKAEDMLSARFGDRTYKIINEEAKKLGICTM